MKKILLLTSLIISSLLVLAQPKLSEKQSLILSWQNVKRINQQNANTATKQLDSIKLMAPSTVDGSIVNYANYKYEYNELGKIGRLRMWYLYDSDQPMYLIKDHRYSYTADSLLESIGLYEEEQLLEKDSYFYDENKRLFEIHHDYVDESGEWIQFTIDTFSYDENENLISNISWHKGAYNTEFSLNEKIEFEYDAQARMIKYQSFWMNGDNWEGEEGKEYLYDENNRVVKRKNFRYQSIESYWYSNNYDLYTYDNANNEIKRIKMGVVYSDVIDTLERIEFVYDNECTTATTAFPFGLEDEVHNSNPHYYTNIPISENRKNKNSTWEQGTTAEYVYSDFTSTLSGLELKSNKSFSLYPNPAKNSINIDVRENMLAISLIIYNLHGQLLKSFTVDNLHAIDISSLKKGIYLIELKSENQTYSTQKLIIE